MKLVVKMGGSDFMDENGPLVGKISELMKALRGHEVAYVIGGGKFIRKYYSRIKEWLPAEKAEEALIGVMKANARALSMIFGLKFASTLEESDYRSIASAFRPGMSSDAVAAMIARKLRPDLFVMLTNVPGILGDDGKLIRRMGFQELSSISADESPCHYWVIDSTARNIISAERIPTVIGKWKNSLEELMKNGTKIG